MTVADVDLINGGALVEGAVPDSAMRVGVAVWLLSESMFFAGLFAAYFTLQGAVATWPPQGVTLDTARAGAFTAVLLASSYTVHRAVRAAEQGRGRDEVVAWLAGTIVLGLVFLANQGLEFASLSFGLSSHAYGTIYVLMTGFHGLHVAGGIVVMAAIAAGLRAEGSRLPRARTVQALGYYWHFVDTVWVVLFLVIFVLR